MPPLIKICGIGDASSGRVALESGATAFGFMLAESRRQIDTQTIATILGDLPASRSSAVGVFVNETVENIAAIVESTGLDIVQLSGDESPAVLDELNTPVWKAFRFPTGTSFDAACQLIEPWLTHSNPVAAIMTDTAVPGSYGGSGHRADWDLAARLAERYPLILAGGLNAGNVAEAIGAVRPIGVDVSTGVEIGGAKDHASIRKFIDASLTAFANLA